MIKLLIDFIQFLYTVAPLLLSLGVFTWLAVLLSKSIRKHATVYYILLAIPCLLVTVPFIVRMFGVEMFSFGRIPLLGGITRDYIHMGTLGFPLLVIIMYIGALNPANPHVKKLLSIRKELSVISGFPVLTHSLIRTLNNVPASLRFFTDNDGYMANARVSSELGAGITSFSFVLGILMLALFIPLWITSFDSIRKRMKHAKWKQLQKWSYVLYATLFIHAMGIQAGSLLNPTGRNMPRPQVEAAAPNSETAELQGYAENGGRNGENAAVQPTPADRRGGQPETAGQAGRRASQSETAGQTDSRGSQTETARPARGGHVQSPGFSDINVTPLTRQYVHVVSLILIFGSYLYLRLRKAKKDAAAKKVKS
ncbi:MAG: ferric reductase-like transmembrane domain-containing protein [Tannerella sp.]|jgi:DMSO/TMAO reductase YedYZ heme-binding membrane subunit|nr:ferric reductase-like transmembrane domain-containing protein [Tannerella sp.]